MENIKNQKKLKIAFICTGNSARSQMAEGLAKYFAKLYKKNLEIYSAGSNPTGYIHPMAIEVMREMGIDLKEQYSKGLGSIPLKEMDLIITLCDQASQDCPYIHGAQIEHWSLPDPAKNTFTDNEILKDSFRLVRDAILEKIIELIRRF